MKTMCYYLTSSRDLKKAIESLAMAIPCFMSSDFVEFADFELTIQCREADAATVERFLAPFV